MKKPKINKKAQEEMVGFALIMIIVAVILVIFLSFSLRKSQRDLVESYEVDSFLQAALQYTTDCEDYLEHLSLRELIFSCNSNEKCLDGRNACEVLNSTWYTLLDSSWPVGENRPVKGFEFNIHSYSSRGEEAEGQEIISFNKGNITANSKGALQDFSKSGNLIEIIFITYY